MVRWHSDLYHLLFPEAEHLDHDVTWYRGFREIGVSSLDEALREGFIPLQQGASKKRHVLFVHETNLPALHDLILKVADVRSRLKSVSSPPDSSAIEKDTPPSDTVVQSLSPQEDGSLSNTGIMGINAAPSPGSAGVSPAQEADKMPAHPENCAPNGRPNSTNNLMPQESSSGQNKSSSDTEDPSNPEDAPDDEDPEDAPDDEDPEDASDDEDSEDAPDDEDPEDAPDDEDPEDAPDDEDPEDALDPEGVVSPMSADVGHAEHPVSVYRPWLDAAKYSEYRSRLFALWPQIPMLSLAQAVLGDLLVQARSEELVRCKYEAIHRVLTEPDALDIPVETLLPRMEAVCRELCQTLSEACWMRQEQFVQKAAMSAYFAETFQPAWTQRETTWRSWLAEHLPGVLTESERESAQQALERLLTLHYGQAHRLAQDYWGKEPPEQVQMQLNQVIAECQRSIEDILQSREMRAAFRSRYAAQSNVMSLYPKARALRRQIIFYCGPTNSGKTFAAFEEMSKSDSGLYLAPLRLLALEGQHHLLHRGILTSLITGEERDERKGAAFVSSTIEMAELDKFVGCAIIDEIQLLTHVQRGWAWSQALLGLPAYKLLLTGSEDALPLVSQIAEFLQEPYEVRRFSRFNDLEVLEQVSSLDALEPGTAVICFSRRDVLGLKREIEEKTQHRVAVVYGTLSPEVRRQEAQRFRDGDADILVATDAIGMGLNLPIKTVLFWTLEKNVDGIKSILTPSEIKQIAGRAGRYGQTDRGFVGAFVERELAHIRQTLAAELPPQTGPCLIMPMPQHVAMIGEVLGTQRLIDILHYFKREAWFSHELFAPAVTEAMEFLAQDLADILTKLPLEEQLTWVRAPISIRSRRLVEELRYLAENFVRGRKLRLSAKFLLPFLQDHTEHDDVLREAEEHVQRLTLYRWLAFRFPKRFADARNADVYRHILNRYIGRTLTQGKLRRRCRTCGNSIPMNYPHAICNACYQQIPRPVV